MNIFNLVKNLFTKKSYIPTIQNAIQQSANSVAQASYTLQQRIRDYYLSHAYEWSEVNLIGIRTSYTGATNKFDDYFCVVKDDSINVYHCTTDPGTTWTPEKMKQYNISYAGTVALGFHKNSHAFGLHRKQYTALVQVNAMDDYIDTNKDGLLDSNEQVHKNVLGGYNIHTVGNPETQGNFVKDIVDVSSAGCTCLNSQQDFLEMLNILRNTNMYKKNPKCQFSYLLVDSANFEFYEELKALVKH